MRNFVCLLAVAGLIFCSACEAKEAEESTAVESKTNATDIAETTAAPVDTAVLNADSLSADSAGQQ